MNRRRVEIDPITSEIISNGLRSIADETFIALMKSAYSTNIKERRDHSTAICDAQDGLRRFWQRRLASVLIFTSASCFQLRRRSPAR